MSGSKFKFSKASLDKLVNTTGKREQYYDTVQHGLCIRITPNNTKTFRFYVWDSLRKKPVQETIGKYPHISVNTAREIVAERLIDIAKGINLGLAKVNIATQLSKAFTAAVREVLSADSELVDPRKYLGPGRDAQIEVVRERLRFVGAAGKA